MNPGIPGYREEALRIPGGKISWYHALEPAHWVAFVVFFVILLLYWLGPWLFQSGLRAEPSAEFTRASLLTTCTERLRPTYLTVTPNRIKASSYG